MFSADPSRQDFFVAVPKKCEADRAVILHARHSGPYFSGLLLPPEFEPDDCALIELRWPIDATTLDADFVRFRFNVSPFDRIKNLHLPPQQIACSRAPLRKPLASVQSGGERIY